MCVCVYVQVVDDVDGEEKEAAGTFAAQLPIMTSSKVIIGSLIILLVLPFLETCDEDLGRLAGLQHLQVRASALPPIRPGLSFGVSFSCLFSVSLVNNDPPSLARRVAAAQCLHES